MTILKKIKLYEVRVYEEGLSVSRNLSRKRRILPYRKAQAVVRRLRRRKIDAVIGSPWIVNVKAQEAA